jgi:hypothetical protein
VAVFNCKVNGKGSYEATGAIRFSYDNPNRTVGVGSDSVRWKFDVKP